MEENVNDFVNSSKDTTRTFDMCNDSTKKELIYNMRYFVMTPAITEPERIAILKQLMQENQEMSAGQTNLTKEQFVQELSKTGKSVLVVNGKKRKPKGLNPEFRQEE